MNKGNLLVIGAQPGSLGDWVAKVAAAFKWTVVTAGISGEEDRRIDISNSQHIRQLFSDENHRSWHSVVCTAGINVQSGILDEGLRVDLLDQLYANTIGPLDLLHHWATWWLEEAEKTEDEDGPAVPLHFVAISSNSAHIARSQSLGYCASKAALSMGLRCAARELAGTWMNVYGYEPGWLSGTPMSKEVNARLGVGKRWHRIPGDRTIDPSALAHLIVRNLNNQYSSLNGCLLRLDGGEQ